MVRRSSRLSSSNKNQENDDNIIENVKTNRLQKNDTVTTTTKKKSMTHEGNDDDDEDDDVIQTFTFNGIIYNTYQDMVNAKRERNQKVLEESGLLNLTKRKFESTTTSNTTNNHNGIKKQKVVVSESNTWNKRKSSRIAGIQSDGKSVDGERGGKFTFVSTNGNDDNNVDVSNGTTNTKNNNNKIQYYRGRMNDGSNISLTEAVQYMETKWIHENSIRIMNDFTTTTLCELSKHDRSMTPQALQSTEICDDILSSSSRTPEVVTSSKIRKSPISVLEDVRSSSVPAVTMSSDVSVTTMSKLKKQSKTVITSGDNDVLLHSQIHSLSVDDTTTCVSKVCPERIYGIAIHPSTDRLIVSAGDKTGYIGIWDVDYNKQSSSNSNDAYNSSSSNTDLTNEKPISNVDSNDNNNSGVYLYRVHNSAVPCLSWTSSGSALVSTSYDGTVRWFDITTQTIEEIFATYNNDNMYQKKIGYNLDVGHKYWTQYSCFDHRFGNNEKCMFISTSIGTVLHFDIRTRNKITFHEQLSDKKINSLRYDIKIFCLFDESIFLSLTVYSPLLLTYCFYDYLSVYHLCTFSLSKNLHNSLHPNGHSLMSSGLDNTVRVWDLRNFRDNRTHHVNSKKSPQPVSYYTGSKSVNSSYFSPSGQYAVATTMSDKLDIFENIHLGGSSTTTSSSSSKKNNGHQHDPIVVPPIISKYHDNRTGRWLSTFMACYHPNHDIFCVGSMDRPRAVDIFDGKNGNRIRSVTGDALTAVLSRCCFHPRSDQIIIAGGNSSGRVTIIR